ncbi:MAG: MarR family transcriptional regulator [Lachnospiraceae bacterium]|nr:MarR family transcriptional regulator [Lachnospiraceae bacterium]
MTLEELKNIMPNCVNCGRRCPIDDLHCERGQEMVERILSGEAAPEEYLKKAEERRKEHGEEHKDRHGAEHGAEHRGGHRCHRKEDREGSPFRGHGFFGNQEPGMHEGPRFPHLPQDDSLHSLLAFAAHAVRPGRGRGRSGMEGMAQLRILKLLGETSDISQQTLMEILAIRPGSLSELLTKLESKGLILRKPDENDRRKNTLSLSDAGRQALKETEEHSDPFHMLSEEEQETLKTLLKKIIEGNH